MTTAPPPPEIRVREAAGIRTIQFDRPAAKNALTTAMIAACAAALEDPPPVVVIEGGAADFCAGADFGAMVAGGYGDGDGAPAAADPAPLYDLWRRLAEGPFVSVCLVRGRANAGGVGFVAACDLALAEPGASFALSELLFGLHPACVYPFLARRVGPVRARFLALSTAPIAAATALAWGLVDACEPDGDALLRRHLRRVRHLDPAAIARFKRYAATVPADLETARPAALAANREAFADPAARAAVRRYVTESKFPWED